MWQEAWTHNDLTEAERHLLKLMGFYPWGGGHWCAEFDSGGRCYPDQDAVDTALDRALEEGFIMCAEHPSWPAEKDDYLCWECRNWDQ